MDKDTKILLGRILGEILVIKHRAAPGAYTGNTARIFGLVNGFEATIDDVIAETGFISRDQEDAVSGILQGIYGDEKALAEFSGYYQIESSVTACGVDRGEAITIFRKFQAEGRFSPLIDKMQSGSGSPMEFHNALDVKDEEL